MAIWRLLRLVEELMVTVVVREDEIGIDTDRKPMNEHVWCGNQDI